jgi:hypothetical protein
MFYLSIYYIIINILAYLTLIIFNKLVFHFKKSFMNEDVDKIEEFDEFNLRDSLIIDDDDKEEETVLENDDHKDVIIKSKSKLFYLPFPTPSRSLIMKNPKYTGRQMT